MWNQVAEFLPPSGYITCVRFSPDGLVIACSTSTGFLALRHPDDSLTERITQQPHTKSISELKWSEDSQLLLTCSDDGTLKLSRASDLAVVCECKGHHSYVTCCDISSHNIRIASGSYDESVRVWDSGSGRCLRMMSAHSEPVTAVSFSHDGLFVVSSSWDGFCRVWLSHSGQCVKSFDLYGKAICFSKLTPNNEYVLAACNNSTIKLLTILDSSVAGVYRGHVNDKFCLFAGFCRNETGDVEVYTASEDGTIVGWNVNSQEVVWRVAVCDGQTLCGDVSRDGGRLIAGASGDQCRALKLYSRAVPE
jgi:COMPASS component SWD3